MRRFSPMAGCVSFLAIALFPCIARADEPAAGNPAANDPIRLIPDSVELVAKVSRPRDLVDLIYKNEAVQGLLKLEPVASYYDNTKARRLLQLIAYLEKELGHERYELLDRLGGHGAALGVKFNASITVKVETGKDTKPPKETKAPKKTKPNEDEGKPDFIAVIGAKDEEVQAKAFRLLRDLIDQELDRQESKARLTKGRHGDAEYWRLGKEFFIAKAGANLVLTNKEKLLKTSLDLAKNGNKGCIAQRPNFSASQKHRPADAFAWLWLDLEKVREFSGFKSAFEMLTLDPQFIVIGGGLIDVLKRSEYLAVTVEQDGSDLLARMAMPKGRDGMSKASVVVLPDDVKQGSLPMLEPPGVISCTSYFLDLGALWDHRKEILNEKQAEALEKFEKQSALFLGGVKLGTLFKQAGRYHRIIAAEQFKSPYKVKPATPVGAFAIVLDMRDPAFAKSMNTILRGAALLGGFQVGLRMVEEKHGEHTLVTYYFPEDKKLEADKNNIRFNFSPCFTHVGDQLIISSTIELGRNLIDLVEKENRGDTSTATSRTNLYAKGFAENIKQGEEALLAQYLLGPGLSLKTAKHQVSELADLVSRLGQLQLETRYGQDEFRFDVRWQMGKK